MNPEIERLCVASRKQYMNPYTAFDWPESIDFTKWCMAPELISLNGTPAYETLSEDQKKKLSFFEAVNFFALTLHGEQMFISRLVSQLYKPRFADVTAYLQHFLEEETKHIVYFGEFCTRYAGKVYPDQHVPVAPSNTKEEQEVNFFLAVLAFEEIGNYFNVKMARDERLNPIIQQINAFHRREEARHLAFGRHMAKTVFDRHAQKATEHSIEKIREYLLEFIQATWREYFNAQVYADTGLSDTFELYEQAVSCPAARARFCEATADMAQFFIENRILLEAPTDGFG